MAIRTDLQQKIEDELASMHGYLLTLEGTDPMPLFPRLDANARHAIAVRLARLVELLSDGPASPGPLADASNDHG